MTGEFHALRVAEIRSEADGIATSLAFEVPPALREHFRWTAGQHLTLRLNVNGEEQRRCYTISNPPGQLLRITVKRVKGGVVSNHLGDRVKEGDRLEIMAPSGGFVLTPGATARRTHYFFGVGSGITPLYAMIRTVLEHEPHSVAHLVYGNKREDSIIFRKELEALADAYPYRFTLRHVLSSPSMWSWFTPWRKGRLDAAAVEAAITETPPVAQDVQYWICGPGSMNRDVKAALASLDVPDDRIHMENFGAEGEADTSVAGIAAKASVTLNGTTRELPVAADQTLLESMRSNGLTPPYSCQSGVCGACKARLMTGEVHMRSRAALDDADIARREILTCQSVAKTARIEIAFPD
jgi:ring-1,2-phenylacetyl-CoA epoxidase subunit PaaE